jgi:uncharacterized membrane protein
MGGKTRFVVCRIFLHLAGQEIAPLLGVLNREARQAVAAKGNLETLGEGLVEIAQSLLQFEINWQSAANEGDVFWEEGEAGEFVNELFTDSAQRYGSADLLDTETDDRISVPVTRNLVVMLTVAYEGEVPALECDLANSIAMRSGLKALINLHYEERLRAIQVHFSPAHFAEVLTDEQLLLHYPELVPL